MLLGQEIAISVHYSFDPEPLIITTINIWFQLIQEHPDLLNTPDVLDDKAPVVLHDSDIAQVYWKVLNSLKLVLPSFWNLVLRNRRFQLIASCNGVLA